MAATLTIGTTTYPSIAMIEDQYDDTDNLQERGRLQVDVIDYVGVHFKRGEQVTVVDPILGTVFAGFIDSDKERPLYPSGYIYHTIDCIGMHYLADKRTYTATYTTSALAGKIAIDILSNVLTAEGIVQNFAEHSDADADEFNTGNSNNTIGLTDPISGNDYLEIATHTNVTITEATTSDFASGTLTSCVAVNNTLQPATVSGLKWVATLPLDNANATAMLDISEPTITLGSGDFLNYSIFISSTSPEIKFTLGLNFTNGTSMERNGAVDQNNYLVAMSTDLSNVAKDTWYTRRISLNAFSGLTFGDVYIGCGGTKAGTYTAYFQNVYTDSGHVLFATNAVTTQQVPILTQNLTGFLNASMTTQVVPVVNPSVSSRISPTYSITAANTVKSSNISWLSGGSAGGSVAIQASYDGGLTYSLCTNNAALPNFPSGMLLTTGTITPSLILKEYFVVGTDPEIIPTLEGVVVSIYSAPTANVNKNDDYITFSTQADWNSGTYSGLTATSSGDLTMGTIGSPWLNNVLTPDLFTYNTPGSPHASQSIATHIETISMKVDSTHDQAGVDRLDWIGTLATTNGIDIEFDVTVPTTNNFSSMLFINYLQTYWYTGNPIAFGLGAYTLSFQQSGISNNINLWKGSNDSSGDTTMYPSGSPLVNTTVGSNPTHIKITVSSAGVHNIYLNGSGTPTLTATDTTFTEGQIGVGGYTFHQSSGSGQTANFKFSNATITPNTTTNGTWTSATYVAGVNTIVDKSFIYWTEVNTALNVAAAYVQTSVDGGNTFQTCVNGGEIPGLPAGTDTTGKTFQFYVQMLNTIGNLPLPVVRQLKFYISGVWWGAVGIRDTAPLGNDMSITRTVGSGWGTAFDAQTWAQVGTGTTQVSSTTETIANTTGDVNMVLGSRTWSDQDCTIRFQLSASTIEAGITLRYVSTSSFYRLFTTPTLLTIFKMDAGSPITMATTPVSLSLNTWYRMRFRIVGSGPITLYGNVWADGTLEPTINSNNGLWNDNNWIIISGE